MHAEQPYPVLRTHVDRKDEVFQQNYAANQATLEQLQAALDKARAGGGRNTSSATRTPESCCRASA